MNERGGFCEDLFDVIVTVMEHNGKRCEVVWRPVI